MQDGWQFDRVTLPDGGYVRTGVWQSGGSAPAGTVLLLTGRNECLEKYAELAAEWSGRGWRTVALDWRGQGGSSRFLPQPQRGYAPDFSVLLDDLDRVLPALLPEGTPRPVVAFAHSMGGHLLLRHALEQAGKPLAFDGIILCAPMLGICAPLPETMALLMVRNKVVSGRGEDYAWGQKDWPAELEPFAGNPFTSDPVRHRVLHDIYMANPELTLGGVTWGWLHAAYRSMRLVMEHPNRSRLTLPVLLLSADADTVVQTSRHRSMGAQLPAATVRHYPGAKHELMMERDSLRNAAWADIDAWLAGLPRHG
jgi:lysophospholipase